MYLEEYQNKKVSLDKALSFVKSGDIITIGTWGCEPVSFLGGLHTVAPELENVRIWLGMTKENYPFISDVSLVGHLDINSPFYSGPLRAVHGSGHVDFYPIDLRNNAACMRHKRDPDIFVTAVSPMDNEGYFSLCSVSHELEMAKCAKTVIFEVNKNMPHICGQARVHINDVDVIFESDKGLYCSPEYEIQPKDEMIGEHVASLINNGDTLQFGIGGIPECIGHALYKHQDMGIYTELLGNALYKLMEKGVVNNSRKNFLPGKSVCGFAWGSRNLYDYISGNPDILIMPSSYVNSPENIAKNNNMVSVNTALQVDLTGQVCSEALGAQQFSGAGGAFDFACGAFQAKGGKGIIAIHSTAKNDTISKIQLTLTPGAPVTISRNVTDYIVTEYGIAKMRGASIRERAKSLIAIAHPDFREELTKQAHDLMLW